MNAWLELHAPDDFDAGLPTRPAAFMLDHEPDAAATHGRRAQLLNLTHVNARLGSQAFGAFDLCVRAGERIAILGPSGAGKSTLLRLMAGELPPGRGSVELDGCAMTSLPRNRLSQRRAVLPQSHAVAFGLPVALVVALGRVMREPDAHQSSIVQCALACACADHLRERRFDTLSGGEQARVQLARVLAQLWDTQGGLLLVDEPLSALDPGLQFELMDALSTFATERAHALVAVLHDIGQALDGFERLWLVSHGRLVGNVAADRAALPELEQLYGVGLRCVEGDDGGFAVVMRRRPAR